MWLKIQEQDDFKQLLGKILAHKENELEYNPLNLLQELNNLLTKVAVDRTHILVMSPWNARLIIGADRNRYESVTHISETQYMDQVNAYALHKELNPMLKRTFNKM